MIFNLHNPNRSPSIIKDWWNNSIGRAAEQSSALGKAVGLFSLLALPIGFVIILIWRWIIPFIPGLYQARTRPRVWNFVYGLLLFSLVFYDYVGVQCVGLPNILTYNEAHSFGVDPHVLVFKTGPSFFYQLFDRTHILSLFDLYNFKRENHYLINALFALEYYALPVVGVFLMITSIMGKKLSPAIQMLCTYATAAYFLASFNLGQIITPVFGEPGIDIMDSMIGEGPLKVMLLMMLLFAWQPFVPLPLDPEAYQKQVKDLNIAIYGVAGVIIAVVIQKILTLWFVYLPFLNARNGGHEAKSLWDFFFDNNFISTVVVMNDILAAGLVPYFYFVYLIQRTPRWKTKEDFFNKSEEYPYAWIRF